MQERNRGENASTLLADSPIVSHSEDRLGRGPFAQRLAATIANWNRDESLVIGLYGPWGSGKSSLKNLVLEALRQSNSPNLEVLEFNPWQWRGHDQITAAFFREVLAKLGRLPDDGQVKRRLIRSIKGYASFLALGQVFFGGMPRLVAGVLGSMGLLAMILPHYLPTEAAVTSSRALGLGVVVVAGFLGWGQRVLERLAAWMEARSPTLHSLEEQKRSVAQELRNYARPFLVVIDDVDRLSVQEIRGVFQLVKANADFPHFIYLLPFQRNTIERALQDHTGEEGARYLEKIVQVGLDIPRTRQEDVERLLFDTFNTLLAADEKAFDKGHWATLYNGGLRQFFKTLRDVKRFLSTFTFHVALLRTDGRLEVNPVDLIALESLRIFEPKLYESIWTNKALLTSRPHRDERKSGEYKKQLEKLLDVTSEGRRTAIRELLQELFPAAAGGLGGFEHGSSFDEGWTRDLRVCAPEIFDRYFEFALSQEDISEVEVDALVGTSNNSRALTQQFARFASEGRLMTAIDRFGLRGDDIQDEHVVDALVALFNAGENLPERGEGFFDLPPQWAVVRTATKLLLRESNEDKREATLTRAIRESEGLTIPCMRVTWDRPENRRKYPDAVTIREESLPAFQSLCAEKIRKAASEGKLYQSGNLEFLLHRWQEWGSEGEARAWVANLITSEAGALVLLRAFLHTSRQADMTGERIVDFIKLTAISKFADVDLIASKIESTSLSGKSGDDRRAVEAFRKALQRRASGQPEDELFPD